MVVSDPASEAVEKRLAVGSGEQAHISPGMTSVGNRRSIMGSWTGPPI
ncbi:hypothetical protein FOQG_15332 [Fusarium oxysporum f. sp. raphani 54005]|nr:hypothetical protein FOQG_15332 [Fusarium oxysporum f. sp. raphani 54005]EXL67583.1 hypothetical protein FOPG_16295 [Fusarium oxysporum f. sp. conglutinans race 2 54008]